MNKIEHYLKESSMEIDLKKYKSGSKKRLLQRIEKYKQEYINTDGGIERGYKAKEIVDYVYSHKLDKEELLIWLAATEDTIGLYDAIEQYSDAKLYLGQMFTFDNGIYTNKD